MSVTPNDAQTTVVICLIGALLSATGALGLPDIGQLFPDNDPNWSGADSSIFMEEAYRRMDNR